MGILFHFATLDFDALEVKISRVHDATAERYSNLSSKSSFLVCRQVGARVSDFSVIYKNRKKPNTIQRKTGNSKHNTREAKHIVLRRRK